MSSYRGLWEFVEPGLGARAPAQVELQVGRHGLDMLWCILTPPPRAEGRGGGVRPSEEPPKGPVVPGDPPPWPEGK